MRIIKMCEEQMNFKITTTSVLCTLKLDMLHICVRIGWN